MKKLPHYIKNILVTVLVLALAFGLSLAVHSLFETSSLIPAVFVLAVFVISFMTNGYLYGIISSLISVLAVNYAFKFPFFAFNFTIPENLASAVIMITVTLITGTLTTKVRRQEAIRAESEKEKMRANLLRAVSHDLRTPLTAIYGSSSTIIENYDSIDDKQKLSLIRGIRSDAEWLVHMVENLLSITKIDSGGVKLIKTPTVLEELMDSALVKFKKRYPGCPVKLDMPEDFIVVPMDAMLIEQVITNIMENAVQHAHGMTQLSLKASVNDRQVVFEIADDGCGIAQDRLKSIFSGGIPGEQSSADSRKRNAGIGLSVCATIIKAHGGRIQAENGKTGGAVFRFTLYKEGSDDE